MPHVIVKLHPGRSEQQKTRLAERIVKDVMTTLDSAEESVSVAIMEVAPEEWTDKVYTPDIIGNREKLYRKPGYGPSK
jgi:4-oxalocrotonate tautomerase